MSGKRFEGKNLEEALASAARSFGVESYRISYHVVLEKRGFLGGTKRVVIEAEVSGAAKQDRDKRDQGGEGSLSQDKRGDRGGKNRRRESPRKDDRPRREETKETVTERPRPAEDRSAEGVRPEKARSTAPAPADQNSEDDAPRAGRRRRRGGRGRRRKSSGTPGEEIAAPTERAEVKTTRPLEVVEAPAQGEQSADAATVSDWCATIFRLSGLDLEARTTDREEEIEVELFGPDIRLVDEGIADFLDSLQVLANKSFTGRQFERRVEFDAGGFKKRREEELAEEARSVAERVIEEGRERSMRAMSPIERRIVHLTLEEIEGVTTESRGRGFHKRVVILPAENHERSASAES